MDLQLKQESPPYLAAPSPPITEFNSFSTVSTANSSPEHIINLPISTNLVDLPSGQDMSPSYEAADPNRIPQSVFARTSSKTAPMEWSVTSNESLFSIHVAKSGDLSNTVLNNPESLKMGLPKETMAGLKEEIDVPLMDTKSVQQDGDSKEKLEVNVNLGSNLNMNLNISALSTPCESPGSARSGRNSETSTLSHNSFAFPVLTKDAKSKSLRCNSMRHQILRDGPFPDPPLPETPISGKPAPRRSSSWKSFFHCCSFSR